MSKSKCETCSTIHGGFHLCLGKKLNVVEEQYKALRFSPDNKSISEHRSDAAMSRWKIHWALNEERDKGILKMYEEGHSLQTVGAEYGLAKPTVKSIVERMGGTMRPRNQKIKENS